MRFPGQRLYNAAAVRQLDRLAIEQQGVTGYELMCRAAQSVFDAACRAYPQDQQWLLLCGAGNNAGDGYAIARLAKQAGFDLTLLTLSEPSKLQGDAARAFRDFESSGGTAQRWDGSDLPECDLVVDALLGTGLDRAVEGLWHDIIERANALDAHRVAVDIPSGLQADTGLVPGTAIRADLTVTFIGQKLGLYTADGPDYCGALRFDSLNTPRQIHQDIQAGDELRVGALLNPRILRDTLPRRRRNSHKGAFGHVLVAGGYPGMSGAVRLSGEAALRCGAGLVSVATHQRHAPFLNMARPELMVHALDEQPDLESVLNRVDVLAVGPGLGVTPWARQLMEQALLTSLPLVVDADALNLLAQWPDIPTVKHWVLTPHPAEAARLLGCDTSKIQSDRVAAALELAQRYQAVAVLKGCGTVVANPGGQWAICPAGNPGMATAGAGDVLTGIIAALVAQGLDMDEAAGVGVLAHAMAGDMAAQSGERGLLALDLCDQLRSVVNDTREP